MAQLTSLDRKNKGLDLIDSDAAFDLKKIIHPLLSVVSLTKIKYKIERCSKYSGKTIDFSKDKPIIFVCNHGTAYDIPIALRAIKEHTVIFLGKQDLEPVDELFFNLNSAIYVDRKDKEDMKLSKEAMVESLLRKRRVLIFPEGTWNRNNSDLMLEMKWGIIEVCQRANAVIVPLALEFDLDEKICRYKFGEAIDPENMTLKEGIDEVRDALATLRWELIEKKQGLKRATVDVELEREKIERLVDDYPKLDVDYEESVVFRSKPTREEVFAPIKKLGIRK